MPFGARARGSTGSNRQLRRRRTRHVCGRLRTRTGAPDGSYSVLTPKEVNDATGCSLAESAATAPLRRNTISVDSIARVITIPSAVDAATANTKAIASISVRPPAGALCNLAAMAPNVFQAPALQ